MCTFGSNFLPEPNFEQCVERLSVLAGEQAIIVSAMAVVFPQKLSRPAIHSKRLRGF